MNQSDVVYVMELVEKESVLSARVAALELAVKNLTASNNARDEILLCDESIVTCINQGEPGNAKILAESIIAKLSPVA